MKSSKVCIVYIFTWTILILSVLTVRSYTAHEATAEDSVTTATQMVVNTDVYAVNSSVTEPFVKELQLLMTEPTTQETTETQTTQIKENSQTIYNTDINLTSEEITTLATLVYLEAGSESYECQKAVASIIVNRMIVNNKTLDEVIYARNQFAPANRIKSSKPTESTLDAVYEVIQTGSTLPIYVTYFREGYYHSWSGHSPYTHIGHTYFSYDNTLKDRYE